MTDDEIDALEAGVRLDFKVAKACDVEFYSSTSIGRRGEIGPPSVVVLDENKNAKPFRPSSDWNDAMWVVVKFFGSTQVNVAHVGKNGGDTPWHTWVDEVPSIETQAASGPVAICRAILKAVKNAST